MQTVTPRSSASGMISLSPFAQFSSPSSSLIPSRLPEKQMTLGRPASATSGIRSLKPGMSRSWFSIRFHPSSIPPAPLAIAQVSPCSLRVGQSSGPRSSMEVIPIGFTAWAISSRAMSG